MKSTTMHLSRLLRDRPSYWFQHSYQLHGKRQPIGNKSLGIVNWRDTESYTNFLASGWASLFSISGEGRCRAINVKFRNLRGHQFRSYVRYFRVSIMFPLSTEKVFMG